MGILDDAIKEHLELKRQHGADASELKQLENEAFGAAERPGDGDSSLDPLAEAPTEFMQQPDPLDDEPPLEQEAPLDQEDESRRASRTEIADLQEGPAPLEDEAEEAEEHELPAEEDSPAMEHDAIAEPEPPPEPAEEPEEPEPSASHTTAEREAIAEHPTEMYDLEEELGASAPRAPSDEALAEEEQDEPRLAPEPEPEPDDFFDEKRLSDELDQALEAPAEEEGGEAEDELAEDEYDEEPEEEGSAPEALRPAEGEEDVLEETPDFLEEAPEDDRLWFEQKPPKDFDFDD